MDVGTTALEPLAEAVYRTSLQRGPMPVEQIADSLGVDPEAVHGQVTSLERIGLVDHRDGAVRALAPRAPLQRLATRQAAALDATRAAADVFAELWTQRSGRAGFIEVVDNDHECLEISEQWMDDAAVEVTALSRGPVQPKDPARSQPPRPTVHAGFFGAVERGVQFRVVYPVRVLRDEESFACVRQCLQAGEEARVMPEVPLNIVVFDGKRALVSVSGMGGQRRMLVAVHESGLLEGVIGVFESYWRMGVPVGPDTPVGDSVEPRLDPSSRRLLTGLAAGLTDEAIARELRISARTLGRRIQRLEQILGADSRFQLAVQATKRGWI